MMFPNFSHLIIIFIMKSITFPSVKVFKIILQVQQKQSNTNINDSCNTIHTVNCTEVQNDAKKRNRTNTNFIMSYQH